MKRLLLPLLLSCLAGSLLTGCGTAPAVPEPGPGSLIDVAGIRKENDSMIALVKQGLQEGDLLLRNGKDFSSEQVKDMSREDKAYSHGGIAVQDSGQWKVYHVEPDFYYINDKVRKEPVDSFLNSAHNYGFAHGRYQLDSSEKKHFLNYLEAQYRNKVSFDMSFDLKTDDKMYCSEMIRKGLLSATKGKIQIGIQRLNDKRKYKIIKQYFKVPEKRFVNMEIIPIDRLYLNPACTLLNRYTYRQ